MQHLGLKRYFVGLKIFVALIACFGQNAIAQSTSVTQYLPTGVFGPFVIATGSLIARGDMGLYMQSDGNLVYYNAGQAEWAASFSPSMNGMLGGGMSGLGTCPLCEASFQYDGNLVLYNNGVPYWDSNTAGNYGAQFVLLSGSPYVEIVNGSQLIWQAGTNFQQENGSLTPFTLFPGQSINYGSELLTMQNDGNLVLYSGSTPLWAASQTLGFNGQRAAGRDCQYACQAVFQTDGNLVLYDSGQPYWTSSTSGFAGARLNILTQSPYIQIVSGPRILWEDGVNYISNRDLSPFVLPAGQQFTTGDLTLAMQVDGNLVLYQNGGAVWAASFFPNMGQIAGHSCTNCIAAFQADGNLVLYQGTTAYWDTATATAGPKLILSDSPPYIQVVYGGPGCVDPSANNFNPAAGSNNGSCVYNTVANPSLNPTAIGLPGVALEGGQFGQATPNSVYGKDYIYPTTAEIDYFASKGMKSIRLVLGIEHLQPLNNQPLNATQIGMIDTLVKRAQADGMYVILDPHNFGEMFDDKGVNRFIGIDPLMPTSYFVDFWTRMATHYLNQPNVIFEMMNEPHQQTPQQWHDTEVAAIQAIRALGAKQMILVSGTAWSGVHTWVSAGNAAVWAGFTDINFAYDVHQYLDWGDSGGSAACAPHYGELQLAAFTAWARSQHVKGWMGETGWSTDPTCAGESAAFLRYLSANTDVWMGYAYWAAGPWETTYYYTVEPSGLGTSKVVDKPQMAELRDHL